MLRVNYNIQFKNRKVSPIIISITWKGNRIQKSIGQSIETDYWDFKKNKAKSTFKDAVNFNAYLQSIESALQNYYSESTSYGKVINKSKIKSKLIEVLNGGIVEENRNIGVVKAFERFLKEYRVNGSKLRASTLVNYQSCRNKIILFEKREKMIFQFDDITSQFYNEFIDFLYESNSNNTVGSIIKNLKTYMKWTQKMKFHNNSDYKEFKPPSSEPSYSIVLTKDEYDKILNLETNKPSIEFAKLFMIVNCRIGLRSIDLIEVIKEFELNSNKIRFFQNKTGFLQTIEIPDDVIKMIRRLKELFGDGLSRDYINDNLKEIGKLIGMNEIETSVKFYGSKRVIVKKPRWDLLTTHVGRRTFATKAMEKNVPIHIAMQFTGHKTLASFQRYINPASFKNKYILSQLWE